jgi:predicted MFS family arabinose efflux permease
MAWSAAFSVFVLFAVAPGPMGLSEAGYGVLTATLGVGSLLGSWLAVRVERGLGRVRTLVLSILLNVVCLIVPVVTALPVPVGAAMLAGGAGIVFWNVITV